MGRRGPKPGVAGERSAREQLYREQTRLAKVKADLQEGTLVEEAEVKARYGRLVQAVAAHFNGFATSLLQKGLIEARFEEQIQAEHDAIVAMLKPERDERADPKTEPPGPASSARR